MAVTRSTLLVLAFSALSNSRHLISNRNRYQSSGNSKIMHSQIAPLILQDFRDLSQFENSPIRRDSLSANSRSLPIYVLNTQSKYFKPFNTKSLIEPDSVKLLLGKNIKEPHIVQEIKYTKSNDDKLVELLPMFENFKLKEEPKPLILSPLFDAHEVAKMGQIVRLMKDEDSDATTTKTVFNFNELVI